MKLHQLTLVASTHHACGVARETSPKPGFARGFAEASICIDLSASIHYLTAVAFSEGG